MRVADGLAPGDGEGVESADGPARVVFQVVEIRRVVAQVYALHQSEVDLHEVFDPVEDAADVFGIEMAGHRFHTTVHDQIDIQFRTDFADGPRQSHSVISWLESAGL